MRALIVLGPSSGSGLLSAFRPRVILGAEARVLGNAPQGEAHTMLAPTRNVRRAAPRAALTAIAAALLVVTGLAAPVVASNAFSLEATCAADGNTKATWRDSGLTAVGIEWFAGTPFASTETGQVLVEFSGPPRANGRLVSRTPSGSASFFVSWYAGTAVQGWAGTCT